MTDIRPIPSLPGAFANDMGQIKLPEVTTKMPNGGIRSYPTKWISGVKRRASKAARHQYLSVMHRGRNYKIHRLVCEAFHGPAPFPKAVVLHLDEDAMNNAPGNLRWGTQKENLNMPKFIEYCRSRTGKNNPRIKGMRQPIPSRAQIERQARNLIRQAYAQGWRSDDLVEDYVAGAMGEEHRALIVRVHARDFKEFGP